MDKSHCQGCRNNFYNGNNTFGISECWSLKAATLVKVYELPIHSVPTKLSNFRGVLVPHCHHREGFSYYKQIPSFAL